MAERQPIFSKVANALYPTAELRPGLAWDLNYQTLGLGGAMLRAFRRHYGGLWVGGTFAIYDDCVIFRPNALNRWAQTGIDVVEYPLAQLHSLQRQPGFLMDVIKMEFAEGALEIRCYGANKVMKAIEPHRP